MGRRMVRKFYIDSCIWVDLYENRKGYRGEPLGEYAKKMLSLIKAREDRIVVSDLLLRELRKKYTTEHIINIIKPFENYIEKASLANKQKEYARHISAVRKLPLGDVIHAIIARENKAIVITRDKHFRRLKDINVSYKPEQIISIFE